MSSDPDQQSQREPDQPRRRFTRRRILLVVGAIVVLIVAGGALFAGYFNWRLGQIPRYDTLIKLLDACDFELRLGPKRGGGVDVSLIDRWRRLTPAERAEWATGYGQLSQALQTARRVS